MGSLLSLLDFAKVPVFCLFASRLCLLLLWPHLASEHVCLPVSAHCLSQGPASLGGGLEHPRGLGLFCFSGVVIVVLGTSCITHLLWLDSTTPHPHWGNSAGAAKAQHQRSLGASLSGTTKTALKDPGLSFSFLFWGRWEGPT